MATRVLSIEIGLKTTKICEISYGKKNPCIYQHVTFQNPENCIEDGLFRDKATYSALLKENLRNHGFRNTNVIFTITSNKIANREVVIPYVSNNKIAQIIESGKSEYFPMDLSDYTISHYVLEKKNHKDEKNIRVLVLAAPAELIRGYYDIAKLTGLHIVSLDYSGNSYYQIIKREVGKGLSLCINLDEMSSIVTIIDNGMLALQRTISFGAYDIVQAVLDQPVLGYEDEEKAFHYLCEEIVLNYQFPVKETKEIVNFQVGYEGFNKAKAEQRAKEEITLVVQKLIMHLSRILDYYNSKSNGRNITVLYLSGVGAKINGITKLLSNVTGLEVRAVESYYSIHTVNEKGKQKENMVEYPTCMGSVIHPIHFVLPEVINTKNLKSNRATMTIIFGLSVLASAVLIVFSQFVKNNILDEKEIIEKQIEDKKYVLSIFSEHDNAKQSYEKYSALYYSTITPNEILNKLISDIEERIPKNTMITSFDVSDITITMSVISTDTANAGEFIKQLKTIPYVSNVFVPALEQSQDSETISNSVSYSVSFVYSISISDIENMEQVEQTTSQE